MTVILRWTLLLLLFSSLPAQNYLWPTSASKYLTASFCEYRPGHYHSAIDIKTWNQEGFPVFAIEDGHVYRIRVSPHGYGKVIYLKLKDGRFAVYAHLQRFNKALDQAVRRVQLKKQRYSIDWYPTNWPVKKGEIIAYTGQTGIGVPHLHFEIRDAKHRVLNPLHFYKNQVKDNIPPILQELLLVPLSKTSTVNGSILPKVVKLKKENGIYVLEEPIYAKGIIGLAIRGFDRANDVYNKYGFYQETLFINQRPVFKARYDTLYFSKTQLIDVEIFYPLKVLQKKRFSKLYREPFNTLNFYTTDSTNGQIQISKQAVNFRIEISDFWQNKSVVKGQILPEFDASPQILFARKMQNQLFVRLQLPRHLQQVTLQYLTEANTWQNIDYYEILEQNFHAVGQQMLIRAQVQSPDFKGIKVSGQTTDGRSFERQNLFLPQQETFQFSLQNYGKYWVAHFQPPVLADSLSLQVLLNHQPVRPVVNHSSGFDELVISPLAEPQQTLTIRLRNFQNVLLDTTVHFALLTPQKQQQLSFFNDSLQIASAPLALYDTLLFTVQKQVLPSQKRDSLALLSPEFSFDWYPQALRHSLRLLVQFDSTNVPLKRVAGYRLSANGLAFLGGTVDSTTHCLQLQSKGLGNLVVALDTIPPVVQILFPKANQQLKRLKYVKISVFDSLSGLDSDLNFRIFIDGQWLIPEWDPERQIVTAIPHWSLKPGEHLLTVQVNDRAGNSTKQSIKFKIKGNKP